MEARQLLLTYINLFWKLLGIGSKMRKILSLFFQMHFSDLKGTFSQKVNDIIPLYHRLGPNEVRHPFFNF
jgi:hypothetical protein